MRSTYYQKGTIAYLRQIYLELLAIFGLAIMHAKAILTLAIIIEQNPLYGSLSIYDGICA